MNEKRVKLFSSLAHSKYRKAHRLFLVEGIHAVTGLLESDWQVETILIAEDFAVPAGMTKLIRGELVRVGRKTIDRIATTRTPQEIIAVAEIRDSDIEKTINENRILIADSIKDPGNLGTMIRTAEALGYGGIVTTAGSVDIYNPKVVRATQGTLFSIRVAQRKSEREILKRIKSSHTLCVLSADGDTDLLDIRIDGKLALVVGGEIEGISDGFRSASNYTVRIPIPGKAESLNAGVAAGIAMYFLNRPG